MERPDGYAPGWGGDALAMTGRPTAGDRAAFALPLVSAASRMIDLGCGAGIITAGLARAVPTVSVLGIDREQSQVALARETARNAGAPNAQFEQGSAYDLPLADRSVDLVFAHAVFEHLAAPHRALAEFGRVLRDGGVVALSSSDWSRAALDPFDDDVERALDAHCLLRRRAGGDPFMGRTLPDVVSDAGFVDVRTRRADRVDMAYDELARYIGTRLRAALEDAEDELREPLRRAVDAADRWATRRGTVTQCWIEVTARWPGAGR